MNAKYFNGDKLGVSISRAGKQQQACWRSEEKLDKRLTAATNSFGVPLYDYQQVQAAITGHANGWIAGVAWCQRNRKTKTKAKAKAKARRK